MRLILGSIAVDDVVVYVPESHPSYPHWKIWGNEFYVRIITDLEKLKSTKGDYLFLISCSNIIGDEIRQNFTHCFVIHESDLPNGRGWSPLAWQILEGKNEITVSVITCSDPVDSGDIVSQSKIKLDGSELSDEINLKAFEVKRDLISEVTRTPLKFVKQIGSPTYYKRRTPEDSRLDPDKSIKSQFNLLRICEDRFPAFFELNGHRYEVRLRKI